jgi:Methyltransferase FkbM domain
MFQIIRSLARKSPTLRAFVGQTLAGSGLFDWYFRGYRPGPFWQNRTALVVASPDNDFIPRVAGAGEIRRGAQLMHNGVRVAVGGYYGPEMAVLLKRNRGVHEPQEERVFRMVLPEMPEGASMLELGCFWAFYSIWFASAVKNPRCFLLEADSFNLKSGQINFALNGFTGEWLHAYVGNTVDQSSSPPVITVDYILQKFGIKRLDILHSDVQGHEVAMLDGAAEALSSGRVRYVFISTHSNDLHANCEKRLRAYNYVMLTSINLYDSFSEDGLIVARHPNYEGIEAVSCSRRSKMLEVLS